MKLIYVYIEANGDNDDKIDRNLTSISRTSVRVRGKNIPATSYSMPYTATTYRHLIPFIRGWDVKEPVSLE